MDESVDDRIKVEVDSKVSQVETRLKLWIVGNVAANLIAVGMIAIPAVYILGQISERFDQMEKSSSAMQIQLASQERWMTEREIWESQAESWLVDHGWTPPHYPRRTGAN